MLEDANIQEITTKIPSREREREREKRL